MPQFQETGITDVSSGSRHTFLIDTKGKAYASGFIESLGSYKGHLGVERGDLKTGPNDFVEIDNVIGGPTPMFAKVYAGAGAPGDSRDMHSVLIDVKGNVYTTGDNDMGQLCHGDLDDRDVFEKVSSLPGPAVAAAVGLDFTLILLANGQVYGCGSNENGELGLGSDVSETMTPEDNGLRNIKDVSSGLNFALYLDGEGKVFGSGSNLFGQMCEFTEGAPLDVPKVRDEIWEVYI
ncbi:hypothetical protein ACHAXR_004568 [Thalassiosira sp. AJA248-18]